MVEEMPFGKKMCLTKIFQAILISLPDNISSKEANSSENNDNHHVHLLDQSLLLALPFHISTRKFKKNILYQFGLLSNLEEKIRTVKVLEKQRKFYGDFGLGSACQGDEKCQTYVGGGEAFFWQGNAYRVTKGGRALKINNNEGYWFAQIMSFNSSINLRPEASSNIHAFNNMKHFIECIHIKLKKNDIPFMALFSCAFDGENFVARSNGVFLNDGVENSKVNLFEKKFNTHGGHLLSHDCPFRIYGSIIVQPIDEIVNL